MNKTSNIGFHWRKQTISEASTKSDVNGTSFIVSWNFISGQVNTVLFNIKWVSLVNSHWLKCVLH